MTRNERGGGLLRLLISLLLILVVAVAGLKWRYGGGAAFPDRSTSAQLSADALIKVADLDWPPGNIAVSDSGRILLTLHPEARPPLQVVELVDGEVRAWPSEAFQNDGDHPDRFHEVLSLRIDRQGRLWTLDNGKHGIFQGRLLGFDLASGELVHRYRFPRSQIRPGSHLNDFQVSPDGKTIYIADASFFAKRPAILVYEVDTQESRRVIFEHESVDAEHYLPVVQGRAMEAFGLVAIRPGVDSIVLDEDGRWLYFAPVTNNYLYRIRSSLLRNAELRPDKIRDRIERFALKSMSDGLSIDASGTIYVSDPENSAIHTLDGERKLQTLIRDERLRWPDGFSFGPDGWLYVTASSLHQIIGKSPDSRSNNAPYQIWRLQTERAATPGH